MQTQNIDDLILRLMELDPGKWYYNEEFGQGPDIQEYITNLEKERIILTKTHYTTKSPYDDEHSHLDRIPRYLLCIEDSINESKQKYGSITQDHSTSSFENEVKALYDIVSSKVQQYRRIKLKPLLGLGPNQKER